MLAALDEAVRTCLLCNLGRLRDQEGWQAVPGSGACPSSVMIVGEGPGADEAASGLPFVGAAGKRLDEALQAAGIDRAKCFVTNVVKCRPPGNRVPTDEEVATCGVWLAAQVEMVRPSLVLTLGAAALQALTGKRVPVGKVRGSLLRTPDFSIYPTFHPAYALRNRDGDEKMRADLSRLAAWLGANHPEVLLP